MSESTAAAPAAPTEGAAPTTAAPAAAPAAPAAAPAATGTASPAAEGAPAPAAPAVNGAPEAYTDFKLPEGVALGAVDADVKSLAKELNLSQDNAQKVVDAAAKLVQQEATSQQALVAQAHATWAAETKAEFSPEQLGEAKAALEKVATPKLVTLLDRTGLGNHAEIVRLMLKVGPAFAADKVVPGGRGVTSSDDAASRLYPSKAAA